VVFILRQKWQASQLPNNITFETHNLCETQRYKKLCYRQEVDAMIHKVMRENKNEIIFLFEIHPSLVLTLCRETFL